MILKIGDLGRKRFSCHLRKTYRHINNKNKVAHDQGGCVILAERITRFGCSRYKCFVGESDE